MASFVVETYVPGGDRARFRHDVRGIHDAAAVAGRTERVHHVRSYLVPTDEMGFHVVEADSAEAVNTVARAAGIEIERIVAAIGVEPTAPASEADAAT